jgi:hypothetical protein
MKKIIAAAVATAFVAPAFAADVTLSGDVEYTFTSQGSVTSGATGDADYKITATEELSNGLSIMAYVDLDDKTDADPRASKMEISGAFGLVEIGNDAGEAIGEYDEIADVAEAGAGATLTDGHAQDNSIVFKPATGIEGLNVAISYAAGSSTDNTTAMSYAVQYTVGGITAFYGAMDKEDAAFNATAIGISGTFGPVYVAYERIDNPQNNQLATPSAAAEDDELVSLGMTYNYGQGKLFFEQNKHEDADAITQDTTKSSYGASYAMGPVNTYVAITNAKTAGVEGDDATVFGVEYAF